MIILLLLILFGLKSSIKKVDLFVILFIYIIKVFDYYQVKLKMKYYVILKYYLSKRLLLNLIRFFYLGICVILFKKRL